jgi:hypothetical protein
MAAGSGGSYIRARQSGRLPDLVESIAATRRAAPEPRDLWHHPAVFALLVGLLGAEWVLRKRWGMS